LKPSEELLFVMLSGQAPSHT